MSCDSTTGLLGEFCMDAEFDTDSDGTVTPAAEGVIILALVDE